MYPLVLVAMPALVAVAILEAKTLEPVMRVFNSRDIYLTYICWPFQRLMNHVRSFSGRILVEFWVHRELAVITDDEELKCATFVGSLLKMPYRRFERVKRHVERFRPSVMMFSLLIAIVRTLGYSEVRNVLRLNLEPSGNPHLHKRATHAVLPQQVELLLSALPGVPEDTMRNVDAARFLVLVHYAVNGTAEDLRERFVSTVLSLSVHGNILTGLT